jgi:5-methylthioadenosine/S-adenosylhomocysteine deaminase
MKNLPLINAHTHAAMVAFRGLAEDLPLDQWLNDYIWPLEKEKLSANFVYQQTKKAIREMKKNQIALFCDMYFFEDEVARAAREMNLPVIIGEVILDFPTASSPNPETTLVQTEKLLKKYAHDKLIKVAVAPHSIYALSEPYLLAAKKLAKKYRAPFHIHLAETKKEYADCLKKNKLSPVAYLDKLKVLDSSCILAHCVQVSDSDIAIMAKRKVNVVHCPLSNLKLGSGIAPLAKMLKAGINVCLGTDGAASSNRLDIWEAGKFAALLAKGVNNDSVVVNVKDIMKMMSVNGLKAFGFKSFNGRTIKQLEKEIDSTKNLPDLYHLHVRELK